MNDYASLGVAAKEQYVKDFNETIKGGVKSDLVSALAVPEIEGWSNLAYVPNNAGAVIGTSGVTLANGIDFGQANAKDYKQMGVDPYMVDKIESYGLFGAKGADATVALAKLQKDFGANAFTVDEGVYLANTVMQYQEANLSSKMPEGRWDSMNTDQKTATMSLYHLYGNSFYSQNNVVNGKRKEGKLADRGHNGFNQAVAGDWTGLYLNMQDYSKPIYNNRNRYVADFLKGSIYEQQKQQQQIVIEADQKMRDATPQPNQLAQNTVNNYSSLIQ